MKEVKAKRKYIRKTTAVEAGQLVSKVKREAILDVLERIDFGVITEPKKYVEVLPILQDYINRGTELLVQGKQREVYRSLQHL